MKPISDEEAWRILMEAKNLPFSREDYRSERLDGGWAFLWKRWTDLSTRWTGVSTWVIADTGKIAGVDLDETPAQTIERLKQS